MEWPGETTGVEKGEKRVSEGERENERENEIQIREREANSLQYLRTKRKQQVKEDAKIY